MKHRILIASAFVAVGFFVSAVAGPDMVEPFVWTAVSTNQTAGSGDTITNAPYVSAWIDAVVVDIGGFATATVRVDVATVGGTGSGPSRTILSTNGIISDGVFYPRIAVDSTDGTKLADGTAGARIPLVQDKLYAACYYAIATNITTMTIRVITSPTP